MIPVNSVFTEFFNDPFFRTGSCPFIGSPQIPWSGCNSVKGVTNNRWECVRKPNPPCCAMIDRNTSTVPSCCPMANGNLRDRLVAVPSCCSRTETNHMEKAMVSRTPAPKSVKTWVPLTCCTRPTEAAHRKQNVLQEERSEPIAVYNPITSETRIFHKRRMEPLRTSTASLNVLRDQDFFAPSIQCVPPVFRTTPSRSSKPTKRVQPVRRVKEPETTTKQIKEVHLPQITVCRKNRMISARLSY